MPISEDRAEFMAAYNHHKTGVYRFCCRMLNDREGAKDVVQDVFIKFFQNVNRFDGETSVKVWLYKSARNKCLNMIRDRGKIRNLGGDGDELQELLSSDPEYSDSPQMLRKLLDDLPADYREVLVMREWNGLSYAEIAEALDTTVSAVKSRLFKARKMASEIYKKLYGDV
ncbi:MAG: RNA polymerase sigma factor [Bacteroidetes bacterium]|nr:RNA polymerase sigma factor [Bacteroidota bacterium]